MKLYGADEDSSWPLVMFLSYEMLSRWIGMIMVFSLIVVLMGFFNLFQRISRW